MALERDIEDIRAGINSGRYENEAAISQGIVQRLLRALGWNTDDSWTVFPEYPLEGRQVDFALCYPPRKPKAFVEVKKLGQNDRAERQLFEDAFHKRVQIVILTDGQEWSFFLPGEQGDYDERRVYKLDIVERDIEECVRRLTRYLKYDAVISGAAIEAAREDYRNGSRGRQIAAALPQAWAQLVSDEDDILLELLADRVESLCGYKPDHAIVASYLKATAIVPALAPVVPIRSSRPRSRSRPHASGPALASTRPNRSRAAYGFELDGVYYPARNGKDVLVKVFEELARRDPAFPERFASLPKHGRTHHYLARSRDELFPAHPDFARDPRKAERLSFGWWIDTNVPNRSKGTIFKLACEAAHLRYGEDLRVELGI